MTLNSLLFRASLVLATGIPLLHASDPTGVYAKIDRIVIDNDSAQIWGVFAVAKPDDRNYYLPPARGYLYFKTGPNAEMTRKEWNDLKQVAGTGEIVAFGRRPFTALIRKPAEKPANPDTYTVNTGVTRVRGKTDYEPVRTLLDFKD
jgi:hypothetical protein